MQTNVGREILFLLTKIGIILGVFALFFTLLIGVHRNSRIDMYPSIKDGDLLIYTRMNRSFTKGDVLLVSCDEGEVPARVVAAQGDEVNITKDGLIINGYEQQEREISEKTVRYETDVKLPVKLGEGEYFVLGDKRGTATDSRVYGTVTTKSVKGKVITVLRRRGI